MRKVIFSPVTKALAILLCLASVGFGAGVLSQLIIVTNDYDIFASGLYDDYAFGSDLRSEWQYIINLVSRCEFDRISVNNDNIEYSLYVPSIDMTYGIPELVYDSDTCYGGTIVFENGSYTSESNIEYLDNIYYNDNTPDFTLTMQYKPEYVEEYERSFDAVRRDSYRAVMLAVCAVLAAVLLCVYLAFVCGRRAQDELVHLLLIDRVFPEVQLAAGIFAGIGAGALALVGMEAMYRGQMNDSVMLFFQMTASLGAAAIMAIVITVFMSLLRMTKNRTFLKSCLCTKILILAWKITKKALRLMWKTLRKIIRGLSSWGHKIHCLIDSVITYKSSRAAALVIIAVALLCLIMGTMRSFGAIVIAVLVCAFLIAKSVLVTSDLEKISAAVKRMRSGELEYEITAPECRYFTELAEALNSIGNGMRAAVEKNLSAERMKTELITNVSHDLKTPLTSIISYSDLLCDMQLMPEEANDYAQIIRRKGERLKNLTQDLFDISRAQSGSETLELERLDLSLLISQALGESDSGLAGAGLTTVSFLDKELFITADGKKLSRVFGNLIGNIEKYAQKGTRVFVSAKRQANSIRAEFKNTSALPLDFDTEEITERFVRGDKSRSTEGSGLGLAIAKSYTELCGGSFRIETDGDLFKVIVIFPTA